MDFPEEFQKISVTLNRFRVKQLSESDTTVYEYQCRFIHPPELGDEQRQISNICHKLGVTAVKLGTKIITKEEIDSENLANDDWQLSSLGTRLLDYKDFQERRALETFERKILEKKLRSFAKAELKRSVEGGLIWWSPAKKGVETSESGWEVHRGRRIDVVIVSDGQLYLEIDLHHRFYTSWTLHQWLEEYPDLPIKYVRNTYREKSNDYISWQYQDVSDELPEELILEGLGISLADYHRGKGANEEEIVNSRVVYVKRANQQGRYSKPVAHLSKRLSPSISLEILAAMAESGSPDKVQIQNAFSQIKQSLESRLHESKKIADFILSKVYGSASKGVMPLKTDGYILPPAKLLAFDAQEVNQVAKVRYKGCAKTGEIRFGCLNLYNDRHKYPVEVEKCLKDIASKSKVSLDLDSYRTQQDLGSSELDQQVFWHQWASEGIKTVLVVMPWSPNERKQKIRAQALQAGIATQFIVPKPKADQYKALNVTLGLLCKASWQPVQLKPLGTAEAADLIIGFDTGTNRELYYGTAAFAVLANGQSLGWELPNIQKGETFSGKAVWQTVSKLVLKFYETCGRYPNKLLCLRDGLVQEGEFQDTIYALAEKKIDIDIVGVRKSGAGRMGREVFQDDGKISYCDARIGSVVFYPQEKSFTLITTEAINKNLGSARPLRVLHEYGNTSLGVLALQVYHLTKLHPASGFKSCRLPWVLHLADKSSKEFQRLGQISVLQNISRDKLIAI